MFLGQQLAEWLGGFCRGWGVFCYGIFNLGDRVSGAQCIEAQESLAAKRGGRGVGIEIPTESLDIGVILSYNIPMLTALAAYD